MGSIQIRFLFTLLLFNTFSVNAQSARPAVINCTGGSATAGNLIVDWNVGESIDEWNHCYKRTAAAGR